MNKTRPLWLLIWAMILTVVYKLGDSLVLGQIVSSDQLVVTITYLTLGSIVGLTINYVLCQTPLGQLLDNSFVSIGSMSSGAHKAAMYSGLFSALATGAYLWALGSLDPSIVIPLTSLTVLYIAIVESLRGKVSFLKVLPSVFLVVLGVAIAMFYGSGEIAVNIQVWLVLLFGYNILSMLSEVVSKDGVDASDSVSFGFWRFAWLAAAAVITSITLSVINGVFLDYLSSLWNSLSVVPLIAVVMVFVFFANTLANRGLRLSNATSKNLVMTGQVVFSVFAVALVSYAWPEVFSNTPADFYGWLARVIGASLLMWGVLRLRKI